jgi:hypothetical protein
MTTRFPPPDPNDHWVDRLAEKASKDWSRQHRLKWAWLRLRQRLQGEPRQSELEPGEGRCPGLSEPELDPDESARIRRAWLRHTTQIRTRTISELIDKRAAEEQRRQERWGRGAITPEELSELHKQRAANERMQRQLKLLVSLLMPLLPGCRLSREMHTFWLVAPSHPAVFLSVSDGTPPGEGGPGLYGHYFPVRMVEVWRLEPNGTRTKLSSRRMNDSEAQGMWRERRAAGWRLMPPQR